MTHMLSVTCRGRRLKSISVHYKNNHTIWCGYFYGYGEKFKCSGPAKLSYVALTDQSADLSRVYSNNMDASC